MQCRVAAQLLLRHLERLDTLVCSVYQDVAYRNCVGQRHAAQRQPRRESLPGRPRLSSSMLGVLLGDTARQCSCRVSGALGGKEELRGRSFLTPMSCADSLLRLSAPVKDPEQLYAIRSTFGT